MNKNRSYTCLRALICCLLLETTFSLKAQAIDYTSSHSAKDLVLELLNNDMNLPPNPPFCGTLGLSKSLTCGGFRGRSRKVATHRFILGFSNALVLSNKALTLSEVVVVDETSFASRKPTLAVEPSAPLFDLDPKIINNSPVLQRWIKDAPNIAADIINDPSFRARIRLHYLSARSSHHSPNFSVSVEDLRLDRTRATINADFQSAGSSRTWGTNLHYYLYPLGSYVNVAPVIGYRNIKINTYSTSGVNLGFRLLLVLSRGGGADVSFTQTWVAPGSNEEAGLSTLSFGYALSRQVRLSTDLQRQNTKRGTDNRFGIGLEWML